MASQGATVTMPTATGIQQLQALNPDAAVLAILKEFPTAPAKTGTTLVNGTPIDVGQYAGVAPNFSNQHDFTVNADLNLGSHQLRSRVLYDRFRAPQVNPIQPQSQFTGTQTSDARKVILTDSWSISSHFINDFRASYSRLNGPNNVPPTPFSNFPNVEIDEFGSNVGPYSLAPQSYAQNIYQLVDNLSYIRGKHTFKFGVEGRNYISPSNDLPRARGEWDYATLNAFINDLVPDGANGALRGAGAVSSPTTTAASTAFVQDDWKITSRLTLNLGLRYEYSGVPRDEAKQALNAISDDPASGLVFRKPKADTNNIGPHVGFRVGSDGSRPLGSSWRRANLLRRDSQQLRHQLLCRRNCRPNKTRRSPARFPALRHGALPAWASSPAVVCSKSTYRRPRRPTRARRPAASFPTWSIPKSSPGRSVSSISSCATPALKSATSARAASSLPLQRASTPRRLSIRSTGIAPLTPLPTYINASDVPATVAAPVDTLANFDAFCPSASVQPVAPCRNLSAAGFLGSLTTFPPSGSASITPCSVDFIHRFAKDSYFRANYTFSKNIDNSTNELFSSYVNPRRAQDGFDFAERTRPLGARPAAEVRDHLGLRRAEHPER